MKKTFGRLMLLGSVLALSACLNNGGTAPAITSSTYSLPMNTRVMMSMSARDQERLLTIDIGNYSREETKIPEGRMMEKSGLGVLRQIFQTVETNQPGMDPRLIAKIQGQGKYSTKDHVLKVGCSLDLYQADGTLLGSFFARSEQTNLLDYTQAVEPGYQICLTKAANDMLSSPALGRVQKAGFPAVNPAAFQSFIISLGLKPVPGSTKP